MGKDQDFLPGREGHVGGTADNRLFVDTVLYRYRARCLGVICQNGLAIGRIRTDTLGRWAGGVLEDIQSTGLVMPITNTR